MPTLRTVQRQIEHIEAFKVKFKDRQTGRDVNDNLRNIPAYGFARMAKNNWSITQWKSERFKKEYPGFAVDVLNANGSVAHGRTLLGTVRDTYLEE